MKRGEPSSAAEPPLATPGLSVSAASKEMVAELVKRRKKARLWWEAPASIRPNNLVGLALSGGGIRSATFSLGLIQGLAKDPRNALSKIDIISSVSGGGYIACFLRSLFMPDAARGVVPKMGRQALSKIEVELDPAAVADQYEFAQEVLKSGPDNKHIDSKGPDGEAVRRRNPLWWLREHSRYLAPNGATDYSFAVAYIGRNWLAMLYIFMVASLAIFSTVVLAELLVDAAVMPFGAPDERQISVSPVLALALLPILMSVILSIAYWMTQAMSPNEPEIRRQWKNLGIATGGTFLAGAAIFGLAQWITPGTLRERLDALMLWPPGAIFLWALTLSLLLMAVGTAVALVWAVVISERGVALTSELRRRLTQSLANWNLVLLAIIGVALVDTLGIGLAGWLRSPGGQTLGTAGAASLPVIAYFIKKLPDWFGGAGKNTFATLLQRFLNTIALIAGVLLFGLLAVTAAALVHLVAWPVTPWIGTPDWRDFLLFIGVIWILAVLSGTASGFINLSSLHTFYASRLTRAYLGATNNERLIGAAAEGSSASITESHKADYIQPQLYSQADLPAPIHIINATVNETIDPQSQLVARDRKGNVISIEPGGINVGNELVPWDNVGRPECAEQLSLGQWCAISGAAASSGMGRLTNLGFALAFTFANVRLGYWWWSPGVCTAKTAASPVMLIFSRVFGTFVYLWNEMTARYSRAYRRKYLTDGGHFENTGAYRLIQRGVPLMLVTDNGADPAYRFADLENLVRTVRLDLGCEMQLLGGDELGSYLSDLGVLDESIFVDPASSTDWREQFTSDDNSSFVLVLRVTTPKDMLHIIWIKPRALPGVPADLMGYSSANPLFPQQPTGDQFFDEAQWESYRKLGELSMLRLLESCPSLLAAEAKVEPIE